MAFGVVAVVFRQRALTNCLWQMFLSCEWVEQGKEEWSRRVPLPSLFNMTYMDSVTQNIQLVYSPLQSC